MRPELPQLTADRDSTHSSFWLQHPLQFDGSHGAGACGQPQRTTAMLTKVTAVSVLSDMTCSYYQPTSILPPRSDRLP